MYPEIIAELGASHNGSLTRMFSLMEAAKSVGTDAIKIQLFDPNEMAPKGHVLKSGPWKGWGLWDLYKKAQVPTEWIQSIFDHARSLQIEVFSSVFDCIGIEFLETVDCKRYKISSFEMVDMDLIKCVGNTGKPLIMSTGMATVDEIHRAVDKFRKHSKAKLTLLKCTSAYPASPKDANLRTMLHMASEFNCESGVSDHTLGIGVPVAATVMGADMIEKHLTLDRTDGGLDSGFALEPNEFEEMVQACKDASDSLGKVYYGPVDAEKDSLELRKVRNSVKI